jgi:nitrite reductase/ring-hydroxylating ferredoxin subunit
VIGYQDLFPVCSFDGAHSSHAAKRSNVYIEDASIFNVVVTPTFQRVASKSDLREGGLLAVQIDSKRIVLSMVEGKVYAMNAVCSHKGAPLEEGTLMGYDLKCPWHFALFDVRNGKVSARTVWATDLESYPVQVDQTTGDILINVSSSAGSADSAKERSAT